MRTIVPSNAVPIVIYYHSNDLKVTAERINDVKNVAKNIIIMLMTMLASVSV